MSGNGRKEGAMVEECPNTTQSAFLEVTHTYCVPPFSCPVCGCPLLITHMGTPPLCVERAFKK
jgi:hypothetical protein